MKTLESTAAMANQASKTVLTPLFPRPLSKQRAIAGVISCPRVTDLNKRTTEEVFLDHLELRKLGRLEHDIKRNYDEHVLIVSNFGTFYGHDGVRHSARLLGLLIPTIKYKFDTLLIRGQVAFEEWEAEASHVEVHHGIDAFVISNGKINVQTIWYESQARKNARRSARATSRSGAIATPQSRPSARLRPP